MFNALRTTKRLGAGALLAIIAACGPAHDKIVTSETKAIFGTDGRSPKPAGYPFTTVGRVVTSKGSCTGTLVGPSVVVTNAHCVIDPATKTLAANIEFEGDYRDGTAAYRARASWITWGTTDWDKFQDSDWAVLELDQDLGNRFGWMGTRDFRTYPMSVSNIGYTPSFQGGNNAGYSPSCLIHERRGDLLLHDCDTLPGHSGGPLYVMIDGGSPNLVGIHSRGHNETIPEFSKDKANIGLWPVALMNAIKTAVDRAGVLNSEKSVKYGVRYEVNTDPRWPGVYYHSSQLACEPNDGAGDGYCTLLLSKRFLHGVAYEVNTDPRWPGVYYAKINSGCPHGGSDAGPNCQVVRFKSSIL